jgi:hypothetical protein
MGSRQQRLGGRIRRGTGSEGGPDYEEIEGRYAWFAYPPCNLCTARLDPYRARANRSLWRRAQAPAPRREYSVPSRKYLHMMKPIHPDLRRSSSVRYYGEYPPSSRLGSRASRLPHGEPISRTRHYPMLLRKPSCTLTACSTLSISSSVAVAT